MMPMKLLRQISVATAVVAGSALLAAPVRIKLSTFAPANSTWVKALQEMGAAWAKSTEGRVTMTVFAGGTLGTETAVVKMLRAGEIQAALVTQPALEEIDSVFSAFGIPFFFESNEELAYVAEKMTPLIKQRFESKGFVFLSWGNAGWIQVFSKRPIKTLGDLKAARLYTTEGNDRMVQWYRQNGFNPQPMTYGDIPAQLKLPTGMINAAPAPPYGALALQFYRDAPYMLELSVAPLVGGTILTTQTWDKIAEADRAKMLDAARRMEKALAQSVAKLDADSIAEMRKTGLTVTRPEGAALVEFRAAAEQLTQTMRGSMVPADIFDLAVKYRDEYRHSKR